MLKWSSISSMVLAVSKNSMNLMYAVLMKEFREAKYLGGLFGGCNVRFVQKCRLLNKLLNIEITKENGLLYDDVTSFVF